MKITCQSCQSKYNVADEKVQGKIVKIRCRKCGATIVVNGVEGAGNGAATADATSKQDAAGVGDAAQWHVSVADNDQRTMTLGELIEAYNSGDVTQDTFIWCEGMDDWRPLAEVEVVVAALHESARQLEAGANAGAVPEEASTKAWSPPASALAYDEPSPAYAAPVPVAEVKRPAATRRESTGRDMFASNAGEGLQTSAPETVASSAPFGASAGGASAAAASDGLTGQRNENSVLFSLAVLTKNSDARGPSERPAHATGNNKEDSGLIDLKALAAKSASIRPARHDDGGGVFNAPLGFAPPLGAPVAASLAPAAEAQGKSKLPLYIFAGVGAFAVLALGVVIGGKFMAGTPPVPSASAMVMPTTTPDTSTTAAATAPPTAATDTAGASSVAATSSKKGPTPAWHGPAGGSPTPKPPSGSGGAAAPPPATPPPPVKPHGGSDCGCNGDLMCLMKCSTH